MSIAGDVKVADLERRIGLLELQVNLLRQALDKKPAANDKDTKAPLTLGRRSA